MAQHWYEDELVEEHIRVYEALKAQVSVNTVQYGSLEYLRNADLSEILDCVLVMPQQADGALQAGPRTTETYYIRSVYIHKGPDVETGGTEITPKVTIQRARQLYEAIAANPQLFNGVPIPGTLQVNDAWPVRVDYRPVDEMRVLSQLSYQCGAVAWLTRIGTYAPRF